MISLANAIDMDKGQISRVDRLFLTTHTNYATSAWIPPFLARVHHRSSVEIGTCAGTFKDVCGMPGPLVGGLIPSRLSSRPDLCDSRRPMQSPARAH